MPDGDKMKAAHDRTVFPAPWRGGERRDCRCGLVPKGREKAVSAIHEALTRRAAGTYLVPVCSIASSSGKASAGSIALMAALT